MRWWLSTVRQKPNEGMKEKCQESLRPGLNPWTPQEMFPFKISTRVPLDFLNFHFDGSCCNDTIDSNGFSNGMDEREKIISVTKLFRKEKCSTYLVSILQEKLRCFFFLPFQAFHQLLSNQIIVLALSLSFTLIAVANTPRATNGN